METKSKSRKSRGQRGFTLVELLVVVGIIVALAAAIIPNVGRFTGKGNEGANKSENENVQAAFDALMAEAGITALTANTGALATAKNAWAGLPLNASGGAVTLPSGGTVDLTNYLRAASTSRYYCWGPDGKVTAQKTGATAC